MTLKLMLCATLLLLSTGCKHKDASQCDFYQNLGVMSLQTHGYVTSDVRDGIQEYC